MSIILVERLNEDGSLRVAKPLWLAWVGEQIPPVDEVWRFYLRRFAIDHWYRFLKQRLHWEHPFFAKALNGKLTVKVASAELQHLIHVVWLPLSTDNFQSQVNLFNS